MNIIDLITEQYNVSFEKLGFNTDTYRTYFGNKYERTIDVVKGLNKCTLVYTHEFNLDKKPFSVRLYFEDIASVDDLNAFFNAVDKIAEIK